MPKDVISVIEEVLIKLHQELAGKAARRFMFDEIAEKLGLSTLAGLLIYLKWPHEVKSMHKTIRVSRALKSTREDVKKFEYNCEEKHRPPSFPFPLKF